MILPRQIRKLVLLSALVALALPYERILFESYCCGSGRYNPCVFADRVGFFALRDNLWYYVEFYAEASQ